MGERKPLADASILAGWTWIGAERVLKRAGQITIYRKAPKGLEDAFVRARIVLDAPAPKQRPKRKATRGRK